MSYTQDQPKKRDRSNENFKKRWRTFVKNGFLTHRDYHADVYILLRRKGQTYEFKSSNQGDALNDLLWQNRRSNIDIMHTDYQP